MSISHAEQRLRQRTTLSKSHLINLRKKLDWASRNKRLETELPRAFHVTMPDGSYGVVDYRRGKYRVVTFLESGMRPPGKDMRNILYKTASAKLSVCDLFHLGLALQGRA